MAGADKPTHEGLAGYCLAMSENEGVLLPPAEAMRALGVSASGLRRYASIYEELHGDMPRDNQGRRLWNRNAVDALRAAKGLVDAGKVSSIGQALEGLQDAPETIIEAAAKLGAKPTDDALSRVLEQLNSVNRLEHEVQLLRDQVERQNELIEQMIARALPPGVDDERIDQALEVEMLKSQEPATVSEDDDDSRPGVLVRAAQRLERWLYRRR
jgi:DNA-binding transcriptional MerR regulator